MFGIIEDGTYRVESIGYSVPELTSGYIVGVRALQHESDIFETGALFGRWTDYHNGESDDNEHREPTVYWDEVEHMDNMWYALYAAYVRQEIAIWDVAEKRELRVADYYPAITFID